jgi:SAM-dependent methyltransferase
VQDITLPPALSTTKFDAVFSNATLHWCKRNPKGVLDSAKKVLKQGGRFVMEMGGFMNCVGPVCIYIALVQD